MISFEQFKKFKSKTIAANKKIITMNGLYFFVITFEPHSNHSIIKMSFNTKEEKLILLSSTYQI